MESITREEFEATRRWNEEHEDDNVGYLIDLSNIEVADLLTIAEGGFSLFYDGGDYLCFFTEDELTKVET